MSFKSILFSLRGESPEGNIFVLLRQDSPDRIYLRMQKGKFDLAMTEKTLSVYGMHHADPEDVFYALKVASEVLNAFYSGTVVQLCDAWFRELKDHPAVEVVEAPKDLMEG